MTLRPGTRHFSMIRDFHLADVFTLLNGASGTAAIFLRDVAHRREIGRKGLRCGCFHPRLARYNITAEAMSQEAGKVTEGSIV